MLKNFKRRVNRQNNNPPITGEGIQNLLNILTLFFIKLPTINKIIDETGVKIDIKEDGQVFIYSEDEKQAKRAKEIIEEIVREIEVGQVYEGTVIKLMNFGAFVDLGAGKEGLVHISKISNDRIRNIEDLLHEGDKVKVKVIEIDDQDRINLSMKDVDETKEK